MMISQPALLCLQATWQRLLGRSADDAQIVPTQVLTTAMDTDFPVLASASPDRLGEGPARPEGARPVPLAGAGDRVAVARAEEGTPLSAHERRARAAAFRALALSRGRHFDAAGAAFAEAARLDPQLDLTRTPAFWSLERAAHEAAIAAYAQAGRDRDAAVLRARVQSIFRPKPLRPKQQVILSPR